MKAIIVYYSLEGNTDYTANILAKELGADLLRLEPVTPYPTDNKKFFAGKLYFCYTNGLFHVQRNGYGACRMVLYTGKSRKSNLDGSIL